VSTNENIYTGMRSSVSDTDSCQAPRRGVPRRSTILNQLVGVKVDPEELHFLILHHLHQTCPEAAALLEKEATNKRLLPYRTDIFGGFVVCLCHY
jgi:hypothetical protein